MWRLEAWFCPRCFRCSRCSRCSLTDIASTTVSRVARAFPVLSLGFRFTFSGHRRERAVQGRAMLEYCPPWRAPFLWDLVVWFPLARVKFSAVRPFALDPDCGLPLRNGANNHRKGWLDRRGWGAGTHFLFSSFRRPPRVLGRGRLTCDQPTHDGAYSSAPP